MKGRWAKCCRMNYTEIYQNTIRGCILTDLPQIRFYTQRESRCVKIWRKKTMRALISESWARWKKYEHANLQRKQGEERLEIFSWALHRGGHTRNSPQNHWWIAKRTFQRIQIKEDNQLEKYWLSFIFLFCRFWKYISVIQNQKGSGFLFRPRLFFLGIKKIIFPEIYPYLITPRPLSILSIS